MRIEYLFDGRSLVLHGVEYGKDRCIEREEDHLSSRRVHKTRDELAEPCRTRVESTLLIT
jgi:hypothetical protein